jgi:prevent-host-death family protein
MDLLTQVKLVSIPAARASLPALLERAAAGEEIVITKNRQRIARLVAYVHPAPHRKPGSMKGHIRIGDDFDAPLPREIARAFVIPDSNAEE